MANSRLGLRTRPGQISSFTEIILNDPDASVFIQNANITDDTQKKAINKLVIDLKASALWSKMKAVYPFVGGTASSHKFNLVNPLDTDAAFRLVFAGGITHSSTGALFNGTTGYGDTKINPTNHLSLNSVHLSFYSRSDTAGTTSKGEMGVSSAGGYLPLLQLKIKGLESGVNNSAVSQIWSYESGQVINTTVSYASKGFFVNSRNSSTFHKFLRNDTLIGSTTTANNQTTMPNGNINIGRFYNTTNSLSDWSDRECAFASIGDGLNDTELSNLYTVVNTFQTTLGRQV